MFVTISLGSLGSPAPDQSTAMSPSNVCEVWATCGGPASFFYMIAVVAQQLAILGHRPRDQGILHVSGLCTICPHEEHCHSCILAATLQMLYSSTGWVLRDSYVETTATLHSLFDQCHAMHNWRVRCARQPEGHR